MRIEDLKVGDVITLPGKEDRTVTEITSFAYRYTEGSKQFDYYDMLQYLSGWRKKVEDKGAFEKQVDGNHYSKLKIQPMQYALENGLNYGQSNAIKYITRYKDKNGKQDLEKAIHCLQLLMEYEYGN